jgi:hypothetical protein
MSRMSVPTSTARPSAAIGFDDRLLAETLRVYEGIHGDVPEREEELERLRSSELPVEARIVRRAEGLSVAQPLRAALERLRQILRGSFLLGLILAALAGAGATHAALGFGRGEQINVFVVLSALLAAQSALLVLWLLLLPVSPASSGLGSLGAGLIGLARRWFRRFHPGEHQAAATGAFGEVVLRSPIGRWTVGSMSNGMWLAFNLGALAALLFLLGTRHYLFVWETTILSPGTFTRLMQAAASLPALLGFDTPSAEQVEQSLWHEGATPSEGTRQAWSGFVIGCVVAYGLAPRLLSFLGCLLLKGRAQRRYRLDLEGAGFARLRARLRPLASRLGVVDPDGKESEHHAPPAPARREPRPTGEPAVLGVEIEEPASGWPPSLPGLQWKDLGLADDGRRRQEILHELAGAASEPSHIVCVCALQTTPDRGIRSFLEALRAQAASELVLVLTGGQRLRKRTDAGGVRLRVDDWRRLAGEAGVEPQRVLELDLDHLTPASAQQLRTALGLGEAATSAGRRIERAFERIVERSQAWQAAQPSLQEQAELQAELAVIYEVQADGRGLRLRELLRLPGEYRFAELKGRIDTSGRRVLELLPARLRQSPRWLAAGAATGALACVVTGLLATPAALATLPSWTLVGGALGGLLKVLRKESGEPEPEEEEDEQPGCGEAVRAAALYALLLELQGSGEERITHLLDAALGDYEGPLFSPQEIRTWLDGVRHRLDMALAAEEGS